jgi:dsRNA-specific ribonuclease
MKVSFSGLFMIGWLTVARHAVERNTHLHSQATLQDVQGTMLFHKMKRSDWFPPLTSRKRTQYLPDKCVADVVEAIIGACIVDSREIGGATAVHRYLGEEFKCDLGDYLPIWKKHFRKSESQRNRVYINRMKRTIKKIEEQFEYRFNDYRYAVEAVTHPSSLGPNVDGIGFCYQRLEYLGSYSHVI